MAEQHETTQNYRAVGADEPLMIAWRAFKNTADYANLLTWAGKHCEGELWGAFSRGFMAATGAAPQPEISHE